MLEASKHKLTQKRLETLWAQRREGQAPSEFLNSHGTLLGQVLWSRGLDLDDEIESYLDPKLESLSDPFRLRDLRKAAEKIIDLAKQEQPICIYADFDLDGICGLALLKSFFDACGFKHISTYQPKRLEEGYGVHPSAFENLSQSGVRAIISVDTGISAHEAAVVAKEKDLCFIVTDHHKQLGPLPEAFAVVNPNQLLDDSGLSYLSGTGVAFYLCIAIRKILRENDYFKLSKLKEPDLREWLDLVALASIADCVDLVDENRALVRKGLEVLSLTKRVGLRALVDTLFSENVRLSGRDVSFSLAPKLNAASRMGRAHLSTELMLETNPQRAYELVSEILALNTERSTIQAQVLEEAEKQAVLQVNEQNPPVLVVHGAWHEGVLGIVAAKLVEKFARPAIVLTRHGEDVLRGSMRSKAYFSCVKALDSCVEILNRYGGHKMAAGLQLAPFKIDAFTEKLWKGANEFIDSIDDQISALEQTLFDGELSGPVSLDELSLLNKMSPFGHGNPDPLFLFRGLNLSQAKLLKGQHVKWRLFDTHDVIGFFKADDVQWLKEQNVELVDALVCPELSVFKGKSSVQLRIQHLRAHDNRREPTSDSSL